ncbi:MAG: C40 family peptidase [Pseudomonadota bacterium]|nr:C40 family peptidase [Pseudomonadota bacterium]
MSKPIAAALILMAASLQAAHAAPDDIEKFLAQKGLVSRLGDSIQEATDRAADLVKTAMGSIGVPYRLGGTSAETGFDCSGFVRAMFEQAAGMMLPRTAAEQAAATTRITKADLKPGDLVFFNTMRRPNSHVGIYVGEGRFIHSPRTGAHVRVESMNINYWQSRFNGARRVLNEDNASTTTASASIVPRVLERDSPAPRSVRLSLGTSGGGSQPAAPAAARLPAAGENSI